MKFLLVAVNAKYIHSNPAVYSLRAYAGEELQEHIEIAEYTINQYPGEILADIYKRRPDAAAFSCYIWNWNMIQDIIAELHKIMPRLPIWLGGPEVSFDGSKLLERFPMVTGIMVGEGEVTFRELLRYYVEDMGNGIQRNGQRVVQEGTQDGEQKAVQEGIQDGEQRIVGDSRYKRLSDIPGLCLRDGYTAPRETTDLTSLPFLYEDMEQFRNRIIYYETSRGCPYRCSYCLSSIDKKVRLRDISVVKKELQFFLDNQVAQVKFVDRTFNCDHRHAMEIWQYLYEHDNGVTNFHFEISADILREEEIALLGKLRPGLVQLEIGVQSANPETLKAIHRTMNIERLEQVVAEIHKGKNIHQHLDLIAGLPYEDYDSFRNSFNRVYAMKPEQLQLGFLKVLKGSEMHERAAEYGICYQDKPPYEVLYSRWLPYDDVLRLKGIEEMVERYYNSCQYTHTLPVLERAFESPFSMYEALSDFYDRKGYYTNSPARAYRYQVLLQFAVEYDEGREDIYRELLTYDMYLRENLKSRPVFAADLAPYREQSRRLYQREEETRELLPAYAQYDSRQLSKMTHLEPFHYPVWDEEAMAGFVVESKRPEGLYFVLFDYQQRNPLTYEAAVHVLTAEEE